ncbi:alkaline phosphatase family protein [Nocardia sp. NPDC051570]|uniref:alkaline phosphatase family protein n=1 Tax=Nocardia sp. NPDC051570 TaxID=3364324 RepID=UPI00379DC278
MTVYWVVWDAAAHWIVDRLDRQGMLPAVRRLRGGGVRAAAMPPAPNCQTPPSLATLFTGAWSQEHEVTGFTVPDLDSLTGHRSGFAPGFPARLPVWRTLTEHGMRSAFVHAPWVFGEDGAVGSGVDGAIEAYSNRLARHDVLPLGEPGRLRWGVGPYEVLVDISAHDVRLYIGDIEHELTVERGWVPVELPGGAGFWVRHLATAQGRALVRTGAWAARTGGTDSRLVQALARTPVFAGEGVGPLYRTGLFGPRLVEGGDGTAEEIFLSSVDCVVQSFGAATDAVLSCHDADLVVIYLPWTDDVGHELAGWCDEQSAAYRPDIAEQAWTHLSSCYRQADAVLGMVLDRAGETDTVLLCADHGMVGSSHLVHINEQLVLAGLAARTPSGALDPQRSQVVYHPANNGSLRVNHELLPGGVVPAERVGDTMRDAMAALREITAPEGTRVVTGFLDAHAQPVTEQNAGALTYVVLADNYQPSADCDGGAVVRPLAKSGAHVVNTGDPRLHAAFAAAGPGIPADLDLGVVENTLGAQLVLHQLGAGERPTLAAPSLKSNGGRPRWATH